MALLMETNDNIIYIHDKMVNEHNLTLERMLFPPYYSNVNVFVFVFTRNNLTYWFSIEIREGYYVASILHGGFHTTGRCITLDEFIRELTNIFNNINSNQQIYYDDEEDDPNDNIDINILLDSVINTSNIEIGINNNINDNEDNNNGLNHDILNYYDENEDPNINMNNVNIEECFYKY